MKPLIEIKGLEVKHDKNILIKDINFSLKEKEIIFITGRNGTGKSSFIEYLIKLRYSKSVQYKKKIIFSYVPQACDFYDKVSEILYKYSFAYGGKNNLKKVISAFSIQELLKKQFNNISSGEKQRVLLALSFLRKPNVIILDEFSKGLDEKTKISFIKLINNIKVKYPKIAFVIISHDKKIMDQIATNVYCIKNKQMYKGVKCFEN